MVFVRRIGSFWEISDQSIARIAGGIPADHLKTNDTFSVAIFSNTLTSISDGKLLKATLQEVDNF